MAKTEEAVTLVALIEGISYDGALLAVGDAFETDAKNAVVLQAQKAASLPDADADADADAEGDAKDDVATESTAATKTTTAKAKTTAKK